MGRVDVSGIGEARRAAAALRDVDPKLRRAVQTSTRRVIAPAWQSEVKRNATWRMHDKVLARGATVSTSGSRIVLRAATDRSVWSGGMSPDLDWPVFEFGTDARDHRTAYRRRSKRGSTHTVTRRTRRQLPHRRRSGWVLYPAAAEVTPRIAALWAQTTIRLIFDALKGNR